MDSIRNLLTNRVSQKKTNKTWLIAEDIAKLTGTQPKRWLRMVKKNERAAQRAIDNLKELISRGGVKNKAAYFIWLVKHFS
jgi:hypothetical protein